MRSTFIFRVEVFLFEIFIHVLFLTDINQAFILKRHT